MAAECIGPLLSNNSVAHMCRLKQEALQAEAAQLAQEVSCPPS